MILINDHTWFGTGAFTVGGVFEIRYESRVDGTFFEPDRKGDGTTDERINLSTNDVWMFTSLDGQDISGVVASPGDDFSI